MMTLNDRGIQKPPLDLEHQRLEHPDITDSHFWECLQSVYPYTELPTAVLFNLYSSVRYICEANVPGDIVECGVHMGGSIMMIELALQAFDRDANRNVYALDTFTGFVRTTAGLDEDIRTGAPIYVSDPNDDFSKGSIGNMQSIGYTRLHIVKGDVLETIPKLDVKKIALLRLDTDTYDTTKLELEHLHDRVPAGGVVIIDDYGYTVGCKKAVDDFVAHRAVLLQRINANVRTWIKTS